jgi:hypothetical protein
MQFKALNCRARNELFNTVLNVPNGKKAKKLSLFLYAKVLEKEKNSISIILALCEQACQSTVCTVYGTENRLRAPRQSFFVFFFSNRPSEQQSEIIEKNTYFLIKIILDLIHKRTLD